MLASGADLGVIQYISDCINLLDCGCYMDAASALKSAAKDDTLWDGRCLGIVNDIIVLCNYETI